MKKAIALFITLVFFIAILAACQATPDEPVVIQKDLEQMIEKATQTDTEQTVGKSLAERLGTPKTLSEELVSAKGNLKVHVDADIVLPDTDVIPTVYVGMGSFTQEDAQRLFETLCGDAVPVDPDDTQITYGFKMKTIQGLLDQKESGKLDDMKYSSMEELDAAIQQVMAEAEGLPEQFERVEPDFSFDVESDGSSMLNLRVAPDDSTLSDLFIVNSGEGLGLGRAEYCRDLFYTSELSYILNCGTHFDDRETQSPYFVAPERSMEDAQKLAEEIVSELELNDFICSGSRVRALYNITVDADDDERKGVYEFMFTRMVNGVTVTYTGDDGNSGKHISGEKEDAIYILPWMYEKIRIIIDDEGVLSFLWNSPYVVEETITQDTTMLPFEDIHNTFTQMITVVDNIYDTAEDDFTCDMYITEVRLGLMRVTEQDIGTRGLLIPVWDFFGSYEDSRGTVFSESSYCSMLTINAIDGSIIDREIGF